MTQEIDFLMEICDRYSFIENEIEQKLNNLEKEEQRLNREWDAYDIEKKSPGLCTLEQAQKRNSDLIKALEMSKARLRSRATYSPLETILEKAVVNYKREVLSSPSNQKMYGPVFV